jgi:signal transduction histidine kinase
MSRRPESAYLIAPGPFAQAARLLGLLAITVAVALSQPRPALHGDGLVILISLVLAVATQVAASTIPSKGAVLVRTAICAVSSGLLLGFDPGVAPSILLVLAGLDVGTNLDVGPGSVVIALAVISEAIGALASSQPSGNASLGLVALVGFLVGTTRKQYVLRAEEAELRLADAERAREEHARAAQLAERANAAREVHDILAHSLGALVLQLDALDAVLDTQTPDHQKAVQVLSRARGLAVDGLTEARRAVGTLREDPLPLVDELRELVKTNGCAHLEISGVPTPLSADVSLALRRTAQEGLTNATKHAPGSAPLVGVDFGPEMVSVCVTDSGRPDGVAPLPLAETGGGYGIEGLRERARLIGGTVESGPYETGWRISLSVPNSRTLGERDSG